MSDTVIIGAGPAGLTSAYELSKMGIGSTIIEADQLVGGLSRTVNYRDFRFDIGGHRFFTKIDYINDLWHEILDEDFMRRSRMSRIHYRGKFFDYPLRAVNALTGLGPVETLLIAASYAKAKLFPHENETNFEQWVSNRFGSRLYQIFFKTYTEKVWGIPCTEISADWAAQRIKNLSLSEALRNSILKHGRTKRGEVITTLIDQFHYPRLGPGMMWERCENLLAESGNDTLRGLRVNRIRHRNGRVECVDAKTLNGESFDFGGGNFISTMPLRELIHSLSPAPPDDVLQAANALRYRDYLTVVLIVKREDVFPDNWIYVHSPEVKMGRIQNYKNWSPDMVPDPSYTSLGLEYFLWDDDEQWQWPEDRLLELGISECERIDLVHRDEVVDGTIVRMKKAYPIYDQNYQHCLETIKSYLSHLENLQTVGRNGLHRYNNQDHSMLTGVYAARNIAGETYDVWRVNTEKEYLEKGEVDEQGGDRKQPRVIEPVIEPNASPDKTMEVVFAKIDPVALGAATGLVFGLVLFLASIALLARGGEVVGPNLSLLGHYLLGFKVTFFGAFLGFIEAGIGGFLFGNAVAWLRNQTMKAYARLLRKRMEKEESRQLLDNV